MYEVMVSDMACHGHDHQGAVGLGACHGPEGCTDTVERQG
jgi:hypothetical protein